MRKNAKYLFLTVSLVALLTASAVFTGCNKKAQTPAASTDKQVEESTEQATDVKEEEVKNTDLFAGTAEIGSRRFLIGEDGADIPDYTPSVPAYQVEADWSNIENADRIYLQDQMKKQLTKDLFIVVNSNGNEFYTTYEENRYTQTPNFVTVDSMMHTYHLFFAKLQKNTERTYLVDAVKEMSQAMLQNSVSQYEELKGSQWEEAAKINVAFFAVGGTLIGNQVDIPDYARDVAEQELGFVADAATIEKSPLNGELEDYTQYKPRGYYEGNENLEKYFRAMMWYGRRNFVQKDEVLDRCALLMTLALDDQAMESWEKIYSVTSFFAGASDDSGVYEYMPFIKQAYGENVTTADLISDTDAFQTFHKLTGELDPPQINSVVFMDDEGKTDKTEMAKGYRFMGQRFTLDAAIFTQLCYSKVKEKPDGSARMLPDSLDVPAAMGSETALALLEANGNFEYEGYTDNMTAVRKKIADAPGSLWRASLYGGWLDTLRPLLTKKGEGYPSFMKSEKWDLKKLETFLSSFTELKHDTILYSKQFMAEMGGGDEVIDDRGYVEPEVEVYAKLSALTKNTSEGLQSFGVIDATDIENLKRLSELSDRLKEISVKELTGEEVTEDDYELIRSYGGNIEHFWAEAVKDEQTGDTDSSLVPAALVVDVATDPNGSVLEQAIGGVHTIYVVVPVEGKLRVAEGAVFSYYQFMQSMENRLTDSQWRKMIGLELNDNMEYEVDENIQQPEWTQSYRTEWKYDGE